MAQNEEPGFSAHLTGNISDAEIDGLIANFRTHPLAESELREIKEGVFVSLSKSRPEGLEYAFCLSARGRLHLFFRKAAHQKPA